MSQFECKTCGELNGADLMMKHLASTRHKTIVDIVNGEEVACEECQNNNIHHLQIIRFGGEDISLLCSSCSNKLFNDSERPSTCYSMSNGSLLNYWDKYIKVRDCCCDQCGNESRLNVNEAKKVLCDGCLSKKPNATGYISESTGRFLYFYLGIRETSNAKKFKKKGGRRVGRGRGKGRGGKKRMPKRDTKANDQKPMTILEKMAQAAFENKKNNSTIESNSNVDLKSFKGFKATGSDTNLESRNVKKNSKDNNKFNSKPSGTSRANGKTNKTQRNRTNPKVSQEKFSSQSTGSVRNKERTSNNNSGKVSNTKSFASSKTNGIKKVVNKSGGPRIEGATIDITSNKTKTTIAKTSTSKGKSMNQKEDTEATKKNKPNDKKSKENKIIDIKLKNNERDNSKIKKNQVNNDKAKDNKPKGKKLSGIKQNDHKSKPSKSNDSKKSNKISASKNAKRPEVKVNEKNSSVEENDVITMEEGIHLSKFTKFEPKLTYPDLKSYLNEFSYALFQEQKLENRFINDFQILWPAKDRENVFVVKIQKDNKELEGILPPNLAAKGRSVFNERQPLLLSNSGETDVWYTFIKELEMKRNTYTLLLELLPWNSLPLPIKLGPGSLKLLPVSAQTSRILFAMTRLKNPKFIELLLGNEKVKEFKFDNRLKFTKKTLNDSQKEAVEHVLNNKVTMIQGPPGTGKTSTIEEIILQLIDNFNSFPILCVAASNIAIDNIAEKILESKPEIKIIRILSDSKERQYNMSHPLGAICLHNMIDRQLPAEFKEIYDKRIHGEPLSKRKDTKLYAEVTKLTNKLVSQAQIIFTTNITAGGRQLKSIKELPVVIMDESTQSSEVSTLVPLSLPGIKNFVFVGDEKQLSSFNNVPQLEMSLFERVLFNGSYENPMMLDTQYRMHPQISEFPIQEFYNGKLKNGVTADDKAYPGINKPLLFYRCDRGYERKVRNVKKQMSGFTYVNESECDAILEIVYKLILEKHVKLEEIGIITPYSAQRDLLSTRLINDPLVNPRKLELLQERDEDEFLNSQSMGYDTQSHVVNIINGLQIATVDSFQGHEKNFIIFSCVRNNKEQKIGFLGDKRRLNVALTRAKNGLFLVGNDKFLGKGNPLWTRYINYLNTSNVIFSNLNEL